MAESKLVSDAAIIAGAAVGLFVLRSFLHWFLPRMSWIEKPQNSRERIIQRYQGKNFHAWMFARFKTRMDWMFTELPEILKPVADVRTFLDIGCGFGIAGCFLLDHFENSSAYAIDPRGVRVRASAAAMGNRGHVYQAMAPDFEQPDFPATFDIVFAIDMIHFLTDADLDQMLKRIRNRLDEGHRFILRNVVKSDSESWHLRLYRWGGFLTATRMRFRTVEQIIRQMKAAGFDVAPPRICGRNRELFWFIATASKVSAVDTQNPDAGDRQKSQHMQQDQPEPVHGGELVQLLQRTQSAWALRYRSR